MWLKVVAVAMESKGLLAGVKVCPHCRRDFKVTLREGVVFQFYWVANQYVVDVGLLIEGVRLPVLLYREVYGLVDGCA